ncbi:uncharacterized protein LOC111632566 [Centruroides sculpturatus]|uniref:uncharacterized protein LOC111616393 n=1 Tax=Centruroides sculpturatus TaxID=218467 RepID=UPI000C6D173F|nr:uncharacterized protein LOC111616393 [Centruroides sculpturatus]XP_023232801.1 uncharacterized protein LOC111632566 [Centruroides sculpturatus]
MIVIFGANSRRQIETTSEQVLGKIWDLGRQIKLAFNPKKTKAIIFSKGSTPSLYRRKSVIKMNGKSIQVENQLKYLGITLDNRLTCLPHATSIKENCSKTFNNLARVAKVSWGLGKEALELIYKGAFLPRVTYGATAWYQAANKAVIRRKLNSAQREKAILHQCRQGFNIKLFDGMLTNSDYEQKPKPETLPAPHQRRAIRITIEDDKNNRSIHIYTDSSKIEGKVGAAFVAAKNGDTIRQEMYGLGDNCSVYQAELYAIERAINWIVDSGLKDPILTCTDSRAAISTLSQYRDTNIVALNIKTKINRYNMDIQFKWVKAHAGNQGNEQADSLAK